MLNYFCIIIPRPKGKLTFKAFDTYCQISETYQMIVYIYRSTTFYECFIMLVIFSLPFIW